MSHGRTCWCPYLGCCPSYWHQPAPVSTSQHQAAVDARSDAKVFLPLPAPLPPTMHPRHGQMRHAQFLGWLRLCSVRARGNEECSNGSAQE